MNTYSNGPFPKDLTLEGLARIRDSLSAVGAGIMKSEREAFAFVAKVAADRGGIPWWDAARIVFDRTPEDDKPGMRNLLFAAYSRAKSEGIRSGIQDPT